MQLLHSRAGPSSTLGLSHDMPMPFPPMHLPTPGLIQGGPTGIGRPADPLRRAMQNQMTQLAGGFKEPSQVLTLLGISMMCCFNFMYSLFLAIMRVLIVNYRVRDNDLESYP